MLYYTIEDMQILLKVGELDMVLRDNCLVCNEVNGVIYKIYNESSKVCFHIDCLEEAEEALNDFKKGDNLDVLGYSMIDVLERNMPLTCPVCTETMDGGQILRIGRKEHLGDSEGLFIHEKCFRGLHKTLRDKQDTIEDEIVTELL